MKKCVILSLALSFFTYAPGEENPSFDYGAHPGGKAIKPDLLAILSQIKNILLNKEFQDDCSKLIEKYASQISLKQEQLKDLKEILEVLQNLAQLDWQKMKDEQRQRTEQEAKISNKIKKEMQKINRDSDEEADSNFFWDKFFELSRDLKTGDETIKYETLAAQLEEKVPDYYSFRDAYEQLFNVDYDDRYEFNHIILMILEPSLQSLNTMINTKIAVNKKKPSNDKALGARKR